MAGLSQINQFSKDLLYNIGLKSDLMEIDQQSMKIAQIFIMEDLAKTFNLSLISHEIDSIDTMEQKSNIHFIVK